VPLRPTTVTAAFSRLPVFLRLAATATGIEALGLAVSGGWLVVHRLTGHRAHDSFDFWFLVGLVVFAAVSLAWTARGLTRRRRWARSPSVLTQLLAVPIGIDATQTGAGWVGVPLLVCAVVGLVGLFAPSTTETLAAGDPVDG
jgi:hypothetical protein